MTALNDLLKCEKVKFLRIAGGQDESPLGPGNHHLGTPTPGVHPGHLIDTMDGVVHLSMLVIPSKLISLAGRAS